MRRRWGLGALTELLGGRPRGKGRKGEHWGIGASKGEQRGRWEEGGHRWAYWGKGSLGCGLCYESQTEQPARRRERSRCTQ